MSLDPTETLDSILAAIAHLRQREAIAPAHLPELEDIDTRLWDIIDQTSEEEE